MSSNLLVQATNNYSTQAAIAPAPAVPAAPTPEPADNASEKSKVPVAACIIGGAGILATLGYVFRGNISKILRQAKNVDDIVSDAAKTGAKITQELKDLAKDEMIKKAGGFNGNYEGLYKLVNGSWKPNANTPKNWNRMLNNLDDASPLKQYWNRLWNNPAMTEKEKVSKFLDDLQKWGLKRGSVDDIIVHTDDAADDLFKYYDRLDGLDINKDEVYKVLCANWFAPDGRLIEKGTLQQLTPITT